MFQAKTYASAFTAWALLQLASAAPRPLRLDEPQQRVTAGYGCVMKADTSSEVTAYHINVGVMPDEGCENIITHVQNVSNVVDWDCRIDPRSMTWVGFSTHPSPADDTLMEAIDKAFPGLRWLETDECVSLTPPDKAFLQYHDGRIQYGLRANQRFETSSQASILQKRRLPDLAARGNPAADGANVAKRPNDEHEPQPREPPLVDTDNLLEQLQVLGSTALEKVLHFIWPFTRDESNSRAWHTVDTLNTGSQNKYEHSSHELPKKMNQVLPRGVETRDQVGHEERPVPTNSHSALQPGKAQTMAEVYLHKPHIHDHHHRHDRPRLKRFPLTNDNTNTSKDATTDVKKAANDSGTAARDMDGSISNTTVSSRQIIDKIPGGSLHERGNSMSSNTSPSPQYATTCTVRDHRGRAFVEILINEPRKDHCGRAEKFFWFATPKLDAFKCAPDKKNYAKTKISFITDYGNLHNTEVQLRLTFENSVFECARPGADSAAPGT